MIICCMSYLKSLTVSNVSVMEESSDVIILLLSCERIRAGCDSAGDESFCSASLFFEKRKKNLNYLKRKAHNCFLPTYDEEIRLRQKDDPPTPNVHQFY